jgi:hypothetical protein
MRGDLGCQLGATVIAAVVQQRFLTRGTTIGRSAVRVASRSCGWDARSAGSYMRTT